jgi:hypothetical protein
VAPPPAHTLWVFPQLRLNPLRVKAEPHLLTNHHGGKNPNALGFLYHLLHLRLIGTGINLAIRNPSLRKPRFRLLAE